MPLSVYDCTARSISLWLTYLTERCVSNVSGPQGGCGSCWAFSASVQVGPRNHLANGRLVSHAFPNLYHAFGYVLCGQRRRSSRTTRSRQESCSRWRRRPSSTACRTRTSVAVPVDARAPRWSELRCNSNRMVECSLLTCTYMDWWARPLFA